MQLELIHRVIAVLAGEREDSLRCRLVGNLPQVRIAAAQLPMRPAINSMSTANAAQQALIAGVINIVLGTGFLTVGATACAIAAIRWHRGSSHPVMVGNFQWALRLPKTRTHADHSRGPAALVDVGRPHSEAGQSRICPAAVESPPTTKIENNF